MKKILALIIIAGMTAFFACGPSAKEKAEKVKQDSIAKADSIAKVEKYNQDKYLGTWKKNDYRKISITKFGDAYKIVFVHPSQTWMNSTCTGTYKHGNLTSGFTTISYSNGKIMCDGEEYTKE